MNKINGFDASLGAHLNLSSQIFFVCYFLLLSVLFRSFQGFTQAEMGRMGLMGWIRIAESRLAIGKKCRFREDDLRQIFF